MWKRIAPILIVLSIALNLGFVANWAVQNAATLQFGRKICDPGGGGGGVWCALHRGLNVTDAQWKRMEPRLMEFKASAQTVCQNTRQLREELIDLIAAPQADFNAIRIKQDEILASQHKMQELLISHLLTEKEVLTLRQQKSLFDMIRKQSGGAGHVPMMGMGASDIPQPDLKTRTKGDDVALD